MSPVKGWNERTLPEGYVWDRVIKDTPRLRFPFGRENFEWVTEEEAEGLLAVFAPDQIEEESSPCGDKWLAWRCGLADSHPQWPHLTRSTYGGGGVAWVHGDLETNTLSLPASAVAAAPWFAGADND